MLHIHRMNRMRFLNCRNKHSQSNDPAYALTRLTESSMFLFVETDSFLAQLNRFGTLRGVIYGQCNITKCYQAI